MSLLYKVRGWNGNNYTFTARGLNNRVINDSKKSDLGWIAPADELVRVCSKQGFPEEYAINIKVAILNCFTSLRRQYNRGGDFHSHTKAEVEAVRFCYNSLYTAKSAEAINAREAYLKEFIRSVTRIGEEGCLLYLKYGKPFNNFCRQFEAASFKKYASRSEIDFSKLNKTLKQDFEQRLERAKETEEFKKAAEEDKGIELNFFETADYVI